MDTKGSTQAELVRIGDMMLMVLRTIYSPEDQGYQITDNIGNQDNQSTVLLASNGKSSRGKRTIHMNIVYFFVTDRITNDEMSVQYLSIDDMLGDFFTKHNQGSLIRKFRELMINLWTDNLYIYDTKRSQEFVGYTYPTYKQQTDSSLYHKELRIWYNIVRVQDGISPGPSMTQSGLSPGPGKYCAWVGISPD